jgi:hypothetical protein
MFRSSLDAELPADRGLAYRTDKLQDGRTAAEGVIVNLEY